MRWIAVLAVALLSSGALQASEPVAVTMPVSESEGPIVVRDLAAPPTIVVPQPKLKTAPEIKPGYKPKVAKKSPLKKSMLSRTERSQMVLAVKASPGIPLVLDFFGDEDAGSGPDNLDLHRSFSRPKPVKTADEDDEDDEDDQYFSENVRLRLFLARMRAVEAHGLAQAVDRADNGDAGVSESVRLRLALARMKAVEAHRKKFS